MLDVNARSRLSSYLFQCGLVTASLLIILLVEDALLRAAIVVAVASTASWCPTASRPRREGS